MKKKIIGLLIFIFLIILLIDLVFGSAYAWFTDSRVYGVSAHYSSVDFYKVEHYLSPEVSFDKYYYKEDKGKELLKQSHYKLIGEKDKEVIEYINIALNRLHEQDESIDINFDYDNITSNDYYCFWKTYEESRVLDYYDIDNHILYIISF